MVSCLFQEGLVEPRPAAKKLREQRDKLAKDQWLLAQQKKTLEARRKQGEKQFEDQARAGVFGQDVEKVGAHYCVDS